MISARCRFAAALIPSVLLAMTALADEPLERYFQQLCQRGLYSLAEGDAVARLEDESLSLSDRSILTIQLSGILSEHAGHLPEHERNEQWQHARRLVQSLLDQDAANPRSLFLQGQIASVWTAEGEWMRTECELRPFDDPLKKRTRAACEQAVQIHRAIIKRLDDPPLTPRRKGSNDFPSSHEFRLLRNQVRWELGLACRTLAELALPESTERQNELTEAELSLKSLISAADEPQQTRAQILLANCMRLRGKLDRASEMLDGLEQNQTIPQEVLAERARLLLAQNRPTDSAQLIMKFRGKRLRLTGELWFLQTKSLIELREITIEKQQQTLSEQLAEQIETAIIRCEDQVGGFWARRCQQLWENSQSTHRYGLELDTLLQQARSSFKEGRIDDALNQYSAAESMARHRGQDELAMELGYTHASILLDQKAFESSAAEFLKLAQDYPQSPRAAKSHLLGTYSLGRTYDEKRTQQRREAYTQALDFHLSQFQDFETLNEARFLKAQLEEQRLQATSALPLYLEVDASHGRATAAMSGAARCYETILLRMHERRIPTAEIEHDAIVSLSQFLKHSSSDLEQLTALQADIALRLVSILLASPAPAPDEKRSAAVDRSPATQQVDEPLNRLGQAEEWLMTVQRFLDQPSTASTVSPELVAELQSRIVPFKLIVEVCRNQFESADHILNSAQFTPAQLLWTIDRISLSVTALPPTRRDKLAALQLRIAQKLMTQTESLSAPDREVLQQHLYSAYAATGQFDQAIQIAQQATDQFAQDVQRQQKWAEMLKEIPGSEAGVLAKQCWRRVETLTKPGSVEWLTARSEVLQLCVTLQQRDEAKKLLQVTKVLYPELGGASLKSRFESIEKQLRAEH